MAFKLQVQVLLGTISTGKDVQASPASSRDQAMNPVLANACASAVWTWPTLTVGHLSKEKLLCVFLWFVVLDSPHSHRNYCAERTQQISYQPLPTAAGSKCLFIVSKKSKMRVSIWERDVLPGLLTWFCPTSLSHRNGFSHVWVGLIS